MERKTAKVLGFDVDLISFRDAVSFIIDKISKNEGMNVVTINPEIISAAEKNKELSEIIQSSELVVADSSGIKTALKLKGINQEQIPGIELSYALVNECAKRGYNVALIGSTDYVIKSASDKLKAEFKDLKLCYIHDGFFNCEEEEIIISKLKETNPQLILVALGSPKQDLFIKKCKEVIKNAVFIGVGGTFDVWAGVVDRAPEIFRKIGAEWIYRIYKQPYRIKRIYKTLPLFLFKAIIEAVMSKSEKNMYKKLEQSEIEEFKNNSKKLRREILSMIWNAKSGHPGGSLSCVDILNVLFTKFLKVYPDCEKNPDYKNRDRFILSKGHASASLYAVMAQLGFISEEELMTFRKLGSRLQGHPSSCKLKGIEVSTGSLGQGLSIGCGMALGLRLDDIKSKVYVYMGDGELEEGSVWEAAMNASHNKLSNLIAIVDRNKLQIDGSTEDVKSIGDIKSKFEAFGWNATEINGHDFSEIYNALNQAQNSDKPFVIIADTIKGYGVSFMENNPSWHGKAPNKEELEKALEELK